MSKRKAVSNGEPFGKRLARLRKKAGYSQNDLASEIGVSQRMIAYYEGETEFPPTHILPMLAEAIGVSADELLGIKEVKKKKEAPSGRLGKLFGEVSRLPRRQQDKVIEFISAFVSQYKLKKQIR